MRYLVHNYFSVLRPRVELEELKVNQQTPSFVVTSIRGLTSRLRYVAQITLSSVHLYESVFYD